MPDSTIERSIGRLEGKLDRIIAAQEDSERRSATSRDAIYSRVNEVAKQSEEVAARTSKLEADATATKEALASLKPMADAVTRWEQRGIGVAATLAALGAIFGGAFVALKDRMLVALGIGV